MKSYSQYDPVASALDVLGERWTLLVVRDLVMGPKRYRDLRSGLPGIAPQLLTARLRTLESAGFVRRVRLRPPARALAYELTEAGREAARVVFALGMIGLDLLGPVAATDDLRAEPLVLALALLFPGTREPDPAEAYVLEIDGQSFTLSSVDGSVRVAPGLHLAASMTLATDARTLLALLSHELGPAEALASGRVRSSGTVDALERFAEAFAFPAASQRTQKAAAAA